MMDKYEPLQIHKHCRQLLLWFQPAQKKNRRPAQARAAARQPPESVSPAKTPVGNIGRNRAKHEHCKNPKHLETHLKMGPATAPAPLLPVD